MKISAFVLMACLVWLVPGLLVGLQRVRGDRVGFVPLLLMLAALGLKSSSKLL